MGHVIRILAHCPFCKYGLDDIQARALEYSIYLLLGMIYTLIGIIAVHVVRRMNREERELRAAQKETADLGQPRLELPLSGSPEEGSRRLPEVSA